MIVQILDAEPNRLARACASDRQRIGQQPELIIETIGGGDEFADLVVRQDDVASFLRIGQGGQSGFPSIPVLMRLSCCAACSSAALRQAQSRLIVDGAIVPSRLSRHCFSSVAVSSATGFDTARW